MTIDMNDLTDISYEVDDGLAWIVIDRPDRYKAFRGRTIDELIRAFKTAWTDSAVGVVALTGAGEKAFCTGGDQKQRGETGDYGPTETGLFEVEALHRLIRDIPKPVIAAVNGYAIGGGHVLHVTCDITIAADHAKFGQTGPKVGSFDAGFGSAYLARIIGQKRPERSGCSVANTTPRLLRGGGSSTPSCRCPNSEQPFGRGQTTPSHCHRPRSKC